MRMLVLGRQLELPSRYVLFSVWPTRCGARWRLLWSFVWSTASWSDKPRRRPEWDSSNLSTMKEVKWFNDTTRVWDISLPFMFY